ncbi:phospholipase D-like domain-containing protein [Parahaliea maris]|nr:phospholipase D-like domain-containing protein [Parahaliea maris]
MKLGIEAEVPVQDTRAKLLGSRPEEALRSIAAKIYLIEEAGHSVDAVYYIFKDDIIGRAMLGALCEAVIRGVDVRLMVDSIGSVGLDKTWLRALQSCEVQAGFIHNAKGQQTTRRARVQVAIFNAVSKSPFTSNRRSHDKLLVVDGFVPEKAVVMTGGRNVSLSYYGILADGTPNPDTYNDAEIILRPGSSTEEEFTVSAVAETYYTLLFQYKNNKQLRSKQFANGTDLYSKRREEMQQALVELKSLPSLQPSFADMSEYLESGWHTANVRLAHEFGNLVNRAVVTDAVANLATNPNSIMHLISSAEGANKRHVRIVSPYLFLARYYDSEGSLLLDEAQLLLDWLDEDPDRRCEMITNSVLTSDNHPAQSVVDMSMAPGMLLDDEHRKAWLSGLEDSELNPELVESDAWKALVDNPRLSIYETGRLDDTSLGGDTSYGKLHAKFLLGDSVGFIGTANFDYRSRLFNNEMGFFFEGPELREEFIAEFEFLKGMSYRWGSPEWLEMRRQIMDNGGVRAWALKNQRSLFKMLNATGLEYLF